jgi:hypothetical protein
MQCEFHHIRRKIGDTVSSLQRLCRVAKGIYTYSSLLSSWYLMFIRWRLESFIDRIFISHFVKLCQDATDYTSHFQMFVLVLKLIFIRFPASFMLTVVYDHDPKGKDGCIIRAMPRYMELVTAVLALVSSVLMVPFHVRTYR